MKIHDYDYTTEVERNMEKLIESSKSENYYDEVKQSIANLEKQITHNKEADLITFKSQIKSILEETIASRYYLIIGETEASFDNDNDLNAAIEALNDQDKYNKLLAFEE